MTQAFNLAQFANKLNTSGQTDNTGLQNSSLTVNTTSPIAGGGAVALGSSLTLTHANSGVTANTYTAATITVNAQGHITSASSNTIGAGTVTSVATGNGLQGGTITSTGTLSVACPAINTVGSYAFLQQSPYSGQISPGGTKAGNLSYVAIGTAGCGLSTFLTTGSPSGTWRCMGYSPTDTTAQPQNTLWCRVS